jgi:hypothetical protein
MPICRNSKELDDAYEAYVHAQADAEVARRRSARATVSAIAEVLALTASDMHELRQAEYARLAALAREEAHDATANILIDFFVDCA